MHNPRPSAWALVLALAVTLVAPTGARVVLAVDPTGICPADQMPTRWTDNFHPPDTIRVLRSSGPNKGSVETANFWIYVGTVLRAEYSTGANKPPPWTRIGALTVKQYAWYYTMRWRGGRVTITLPDGSTQLQCYDVKDTTADQIYRPEKWDSGSGTWVPGNVPSPANLEAMRETWHMTMRKWKAKKVNASVMFLSGYRSGRRNPCGADATGYKIYQKSLRDCGVKQLTFEEVQREYFEPSEIVNVRGHDVLADGSGWFGDLAVLQPGGSWRLYRGAADGFATNALTGSFGNIGTVLGQGIGEVTGADANGANDDRLLADLVVLVNNGGRKLLTAKATGSGFAAPTSQNAPASADQLLVADFDGDLVADAGLLSFPSPGTTTLSVMRGQGGGTFAAAVDWWTGPINLSSADDYVAAADVNGDGKADLVMRDAGGAYMVAPSFASCADFSNWGPCLNVPGTGLDQAAIWLDTPAWTLANARHAITDYDRDGRDDLLVITPAQSGEIKIMALRSLISGGFAAPVQLWQGAGSVGEVVPVGMHVNPDGLGDVALLQKGAQDKTKLSWLRSIAKTISSGPGSMSQTSSFTDATFGWSLNNAAF